MDNSALKIMGFNFLEYPHLLFLVVSLEAQSWNHKNGFFCDYF